MTTTSVQPVTTQQIAGKPWKTAPVKSGKGAPATGAERTTKAVAYAYVLGPKRTKNKTNGEPAFFTTGIFDTAKEAPEQAAARAIGERWHKIEPNAGDWEVIFDEDVLHYPDFIDVGYVGLAVYYTPGQSSLITETTDDIQLGAPANIYIGLMQDGEILGTPYLAFGGQVDQPSIRIGPDTMTISLSLENRLSNLQRANQRRYTSADQRQYYSDDTGFSWVEMLSDEALRWGS
jgi:hypothetical protein